MGAEPYLRSHKLADGVLGLRFGHFELDLASGELRKSGVRVKLQLQPFRVLVLLASQPDRVLTREEIQREVWPDGTFVDFEQALNFCIRQIRAALGDQAATPRYLETLPRRGYRFIGPVETIETSAPVLRDRTAPARGDSAPVLFPVPVRDATARTRWTERWTTVALIALAVLATLSALYLALRPMPTPAAPSFHRVTFGRGYIGSARFAPGEQVLYSAAWDGREMGVYAVRPEGLDSRAVTGIAPRLVAVSEAGEVAFFQGERLLRRAPLAGGPAKDVLDGVDAADWSRDGTDFAIARTTNGVGRIEFPVGNVLCEAVRPSHVRLSPDGTRVAFLEHPLPGDDRGAVVVVDRGGRKTVLSDDWASAHGLAWSPDGKEVWFTAARVGADSALNAVGLNGSERTLVPALGRFVLHDVAPDGTVLLERNTLRLEVRYRRFSDPEERDLSWLDLSKVVQLSPDASRLLFYESGQGGGLEYSAYLRATDGAVPVRVGPGRATSLSPDGRWVLALPVRASDRVDVLPTGAGEPLVVRDPGFTAYEWASWLPDGETLVLTARRGTEQPRVYLRRLSGGPPVPVTPPGVAMWGNLVSPDGSRIVTRGQGGIGLHSVRGGEPEPLSLDGSMEVTGWGGPETLYVRDKTRFPGQLQRFNLKTHRLEPWLTLAPPDPSGVRRVNSISVSADAAAYAYSYSRQLSDLYVVDGLR